jgi:hypothetical protein
MENIAVVKWFLALAKFTQSSKIIGKLSMEFWNYCIPAICLILKGIHTIKKVTGFINKPVTLIINIINYLLVNLVLIY